MVWSCPTSQSLITQVQSGLFVSKGAFECNLTKSLPFLKNLHNPFGKKFSFRYPVSEILDYKKSKNNSFLFLNK